MMCSCQHFSLAQAEVGKYSKQKTARHFMVLLTRNQLSAAPQARSMFGWFASHHYKLQQRGFVFLVKAEQ